MSEVSFSSKYADLFEEPSGNADISIAPLSCDAGGTQGRLPQPHWRDHSEGAYSGRKRCRLSNGDGDTADTLVDGHARPDARDIFKDTEVFSGDDDGSSTLPMDGGIPVSCSASAMPRAPEGATTGSDTTDSYDRCSTTSATDPRLQWLASVLVDEDLDCVPDLAPTKLYARLRAL